MLLSAITDIVAEEPPNDDCISMYVLYINVQSLLFAVFQAEILEST